MADRREFEISGKPLSSLRVVDLKQELEKRGLSKSGSKKDLVERLKMHLKLERLHESASTDEGHVPNLKLQDEIDEPNDVIKEYLAKQQKIYEMQKEARRRVELEQRVRESSEASAGDTSQEEEEQEPPVYIAESCALDMSIGETSAASTEWSESLVVTDDGRKTASDPVEEIQKISVQEYVEPISEQQLHMQNELCVSELPPMSTGAAELVGESNVDYSTTSMSVPELLKPGKDDFIQSMEAQDDTKGKDYSDDISATVSEPDDVVILSDLPELFADRRSPPSCVSETSDNVSIGSVAPVKTSEHVFKSHSEVEETAQDRSGAIASADNDSVDVTIVTQEGLLTSTTEEIKALNIVQTEYQKEIASKELETDVPILVIADEESKDDESFAQETSEDVAAMDDPSIEKTSHDMAPQVPSILPDNSEESVERLQPAVDFDEEKHSSPCILSVSVDATEGLEESETRNMDDEFGPSSAMPDAVKKDVAESTKVDRRSASSSERDNGKVSRSGSSSASTGGRRNNRQRQRTSSVSSNDSNSSSSSRSSVNSGSSSISSSSAGSGTPTLRSSRKLKTVDSRRTRQQRSSPNDESVSRTFPRNNDSVNDEATTVTMEVEESITIDSLTPPDEVKDEKTQPDNEPKEKDASNGVLTVGLPPRIGSRKISLSSSKERKDDDNDKNGAEEKPLKRRKWGGSATGIVKRSSVSISTDSLKGLIPDVKPSPTSLITTDNESEPPPIAEEATNKRESETESGTANSVKREPIVFRKLPSVTKDQGKIIGKSLKEDVVRGKTQVSTISPKVPVVAPRPDSPPVGRRSPTPARNSPTCILHIRNLVRPFTLNQLKELLSQTGTLVESEFWIDKIKSKCYATYEMLDQAVTTRHTLHGTQWPFSNPKKLTVDYATQDELDFHRSLAESLEIPKPIMVVSGVDERLPVKMPRSHDGPATQLVVKERRRSVKELEPEVKRVKRDRHSTEHGNDMSNRHQLQPVREWDRDKIGEKSPGERARAARPGVRRERISQTREHSPRHVRGEQRPKIAKERERHGKGDIRDKRDRRERRKEEEEEAPAKLLDDLFRKTKTTPCIYWLPLTGDQIKAKEEERRQRQAEREKRRQQIDVTEKDHIIGANLEQNMRRNRDRDESRNRRRSWTPNRSRNRRH